MRSKATFPGSLILLASLGYAVAGPAVSDKRFWPNEVGPGTYRQMGDAPYARMAPRTPHDKATDTRVSPRSCTYHGDP